MRVSHGYEPFATIKALSDGAVMGTVDLFASMSNFKYEIRSKIEKLEKKIDEVKELLITLEGYYKRLIKIVKEWVPA